MLRRPLGTATALALAAALLTTAPPAQASVTGTTSSSDVVLSNTCRTHPISYSMAVAPGTVLWKVKITVVSPSGHTAEGFDLSSATGSPTSGTVGFLVCGSYDPGTYTVHSVGAYQVVPAVNIPFTLADSTFAVRRAATRTALATRHLHGDRYRLVATVKDERRRGFKPTSSAEVVFERKVNGVWKVVRGSRGLTDHGRATCVVTAGSGAKVRAVTAHAGYLAGSTSRASRLHP